MTRSTTLPRSAAILALLLSSGCATAPPEEKKAVPAPGVADWTLGLEKSAVTGVPVPKLSEYGTKDPGDGKLLPRPFALYPPLIPHSVDGLLPVTRAENGCLACHAIDTARTKVKPGDPVPIPPSHYLDLRNAPTVKRADIAGSRYVCTACHVPQTDARGLAANRYRP
jgi:cytochrome c-type protein NapB